MKKLLSILALLPVIAFGQINIRPVTQINDINKVGSEYYAKQVTWFQGESLRFDVFARDVRTPIDLSGQVFPVLFVGAETNNQQVYIARTGTVVSATNGHVRVEVPYELALLPTNTKYAAWMIAFRVTAGVTQEIATVAYSAVNVYPSPLGVVYTNIAPQTSYVINASGILAEFDPVFTGSVAAAITSGLTSQWSTAYGWGNHATNAYATTNQLALKADSISLSDYYTSSQADALFATGSPLYGFTELDPAFAAWLATNTYVQIESDPIWSAASNNIQSRIAATETGKVALTTYEAGTNDLWTAIGAIVSADTALTNVTGDARISAVKAGNEIALTFDASGFATGAPIYSLEGYVTGDVIRAESDPIWSAAESNYYTAAQADALFATGSPLYEVDLTPYVTGDVVRTESDPVWSAAESNYYTRSEADALFITSAPVTVETDPVFGAWLAANGSAPEESYAPRSVVATNPVIATNILVFDGMTNFVIALPTNGIAYVEIESDVGANQVNLVYDEGFSGIPPGTSTVYIGSATSTDLTISDSDGIPGLIASDITNIISKISVYQYLNPPAFGTTNDFRLMTVLVPEAELPNEPVTKGTFDAVVGAIRVDQWSQSPAVTALDVNGNEIRFGNNFQALATSNAFTFSYNNSPFMRFLAGTGSGIGSGETYIASAIITQTNVVLGVYASPGYIPRPQYATDPTNWFDILSYESSYPTNNYGVYTISFDTPSTNQTLFFRPTLDADNAYDSENTVEITADNLLLLGRRMVINDTNGNGIVTLSATGGLKVGTASFTADAAGNIAQDATNSAALGLVYASFLEITNSQSETVSIGSAGPNGVFNVRATPVEKPSFSVDTSNTNKMVQVFGGAIRVVDKANEQGITITPLGIYDLLSNNLITASGNISQRPSDTAALGVVTVESITGAFIGDGSGLTNLSLTADLTSYATTGQLAAVNTSLTAAIALKLNASETNSLVYTGALATTLSGYVTTGALETALGGYATTGALEVVFETLNDSKLDITDAADTYATIEDFDAAVSNLTDAIDLKLDISATNDFVTSDTLTSTLTGYVETNALSAELANYATTAALSGYVATNGSAAALTSFPASLATVSGSNSNYWRITTAPASNASFGSRGQIAVSSSNLFIYNPDALGTGTGRWIRISGDLAW